MGNFHNKRPWVLRRMGAATEIPGTVGTFIEMKIAVIFVDEQINALWAFDHW